MKEEISKYYRKIDDLIGIISDTAQLLYAETSKGEECDEQKVSNFQNCLKAIVGTRSPSEVIATLVKIQAKLTELMPGEASRDSLMIDEAHYQAAYVYFIERYEKEELYRDRCCTQCGHKQEFLDHFTGVKKPSSFRQYLEKITNREI